MPAFQAFYDQFSSLFTHKAAQPSPDHLSDSLKSCLYSYIFRSVVEKPDTRRKSSAPIQSDRSGHSNPSRSVERSFLSNFSEPLLVGENISDSFLAHVPERVGRYQKPAKTWAVRLAVGGVITPQFAGCLSLFPTRASNVNISTIPFMILLYILGESLLNRSAYGLKRVKTLLFSGFRNLLDHFGVQVRFKEVDPMIQCFVRLQEVKAKKANLIANYAKVRICHFKTV